jgi:hypothetical protein
VNTSDPIPPREALLSSRLGTGGTMVILLIAGRLAGRVTCFAPASRRAAHGAAFRAASFHRQGQRLHRTAACSSSSQVAADF